MGRQKESDYASIMNLNNLEKEIDYFYPDDSSEIWSLIAEVTEKIDGENIRIGIDDEGREFIGQRSIGQTFYRDGDEFFKKGNSRHGNQYNKPHPYWNSFSDEAKKCILTVLDRCRELKKPVTFYGELYGTGRNGDGMTWYSDKLNIIFFDIKDSGKYVSPNDRDKYTGNIDIEWVPIIGTMTIEEAINLNVEEMNSKVAKSGLAEGVVIVPLEIPDGWKTGKRLIIKHKRKARSEMKDVSEQDKKRFHSAFIKFVTFERIDKARQQAEMNGESLTGGKQDIPTLIGYVVKDIEFEENNGVEFSKEDKSSVKKYAGRECALYIDKMLKERIDKRIKN